MTKREIAFKLGLYEKITLVLITALFSVFGYCVIHYKELDFIISVCAAIGALSLILALALFVALIFKELKNLRRLK